MMAVATEPRTDEVGSCAKAGVAVTLAMERAANRTGGEERNRPGGRKGRAGFAVDANTDGSEMAGIIADVRRAIAATPLPGSYFVSIEGQFQAQEQATKLMVTLSLVSLAMIFHVDRDVARLCFNHAS